MSASEFIDLPELMSARGTIRLPGSKSISNRVLLLAALAEGETEIRDLLESDDTARMREALVSLGVTMTPSASFVIVRNAHPCMYAETMVCGIANSNEVSSARPRTPYGSTPPRSHPSNTLRSASALTAFAGHPTHALTFGQIRSGMLMSKSLNWYRAK